MSYLCDLYSHHTLKGEEYDEETMIIQINLSYGLGKEKEIRIYHIQDEEEKRYVKNFEIIEVNMDYFSKIWYSKDKEKIKENKYLIMLGLEKEELKELSLKNKGVKKYMEELNKINEDPEFREYMSYEEDQRKIFNSEMSYARRKGKEEGLKEGEYESKINIAKEMLKNGIDIDLISKCTGLTIEEITKIN